MKPAICFTRKKQQQQQQKDQKKKKKHLQQWELNPRPRTWKVNMTVIYCATTTSIENPDLKLIIFNTFAHEILLVDAV